MSFLIRFRRAKLYHSSVNFAPPILLATIASSRTQSPSVQCGSLDLQCMKLQFATPPRFNRPTETPQSVWILESAGGGIDRAFQVLRAAIATFETRRRPRDAYERPLRLL